MARDPMLEASIDEVRIALTRASFEGLNQSEILSLTGLSVPEVREAMAEMGDEVRADDDGRYVLTEFAPAPAMEDDPEEDPTKGMSIAEIAQAEVDSIDAAEAGGGDNTRYTLTLEVAVDYFPEYPDGVTETPDVAAFREASEMAVLVETALTEKWVDLPVRTRVVSLVAWDKPRTVFPA